MSKKRPAYNKGIKKYMLYYLVSLVLLEALALYFPMLLQNLTVVAQEQFEGDKSVVPLVMQGILVFGFITLIFVVSFWSELMGALYADKYQANLRTALYNKFSKVIPEQIEQIGVARIMPVMMNDTNWVRQYNRRLVQLFVYFPVMILGSIIMLFNLHIAYALIALVSLPFVIIFFYINMRHIKKTIPKSVESYDEHFLEMKEGIKGAKEIRLLGKVDERSAVYEQHVKNNMRQVLTTKQSHALSTGFTAILFTIITIVIVIYGAANNLTAGEMSGVVVLNTAIQYVNRIWTGSHQMFIWFVDFLPRTQYAKKRFDKFYALAEREAESGLTQIPLYKRNTFKITDMTYIGNNGKVELSKITMDIEHGKMIAIAGGINSGKSRLAGMIIKNKSATEGSITFNEIDINQINTNYWRRECVSFCSAYPKFVPGTVRYNMQLLSPNITDEQILGCFRDIGATDLLKKFKSILDYEIGENSNMSEGIKKVLNIVRAILKPAEIYIFNQCFEHVKTEYIARIMAKMRHEKKTALFFSYNDTICKLCDKVYFMKGGKVITSGTHSEVLKQSSAYRELNLLGDDTIIQEEFKMEQVGREVATENGGVHETK